MSLNWKKSGRFGSAEGTMIDYRAEGCELTVRSWKRQIPHASRGGTWEYTSYLVMKDGKTLAEKQSLRDAKEAAERMAKRADEVPEDCFGEMA